MTGYLALLLFCVLAVPASATQYYVNAATGSDSNNGTSTGTPYLTMGKCAATMLANGATQADTCTVYAGTYNENVTVPAGGIGLYKIFTVNGSDAVSVLSFTLNSHDKIVGNCLPGAAAGSCGFTIQNPSSPNSTTCVSVSASATDFYLLNTVIYACANGINESSGVSFGYIQNNTISYTCSTASAPNVCRAITLNGDHQLVEGNDISHVSDGPYAFGQNIAFRNNVFHDLSDLDCGSNSSNCHVDLGQHDSSGTVTKYILWEGTKVHDLVIHQPFTRTANTHSTTTVDGFTDMTGIAVNDTVTGSGIPANTTVASVSGSSITLTQSATSTVTGDSLTFSGNGMHAGPLFQGTSACSTTNCANAIIRFQQSYHIYGGGTTANGSPPAWLNVKSYNNSWVDMFLQQPGSGAEVNPHTYAGAANLNEIYYWTANAGTPNQWNAYDCQTSCAGYTYGASLAFAPGLSASCQIAGTTQIFGHTYGSGAFTLDVGNVCADPLFNNYAGNDFHLTSSSPAKGTGTSLTTANGAGANSTTLVVADAGFFQDGYGLTGVQADWIRIGASTVVQIASGGINYATNTITLASAVSWNNLDPIYLYKDSSGRLVLTATSGTACGGGSCPDMGALPFQPAAGCSLTLTGMGAC